MVFGLRRDSLFGMHRDAVIRRFIAWLSLVGYAIVASGWPLPLGVVAPGGASPATEKRLAAKDRTMPFPCMDKACGCVTAEQCFSNCCCNTPAETLAWARANGVDAGVIAALQRRVATPAQTAVASSCCAAKKQASCCSAPSEPAGGPEMEAVASPVSLGGPGDRSDVERVSSRTLVLKAMLACGGIVSQWFAIGAAIPSPIVCAVVSSAPCVEVIQPGEDGVPCDRSAPDTPPPRVA